MIKILKGIWKIFQWILAVALGIGALGAFTESFAAGLCWTAAALLICPKSRNALIKIITKKQTLHFPFSAYVIKRLKSIHKCIKLKHSKGSCAMREPLLIIHGLLCYL